MTTESELEQRLNDLEMRIAFQDQMLEEINRTVTTQQGHLDTIVSQLRELLGQVNSALVVSKAEDSKPPHY